jgi:uncharacterized membrane protein
MPITKASIGASATPKPAITGSSESRPPQAVTRTQPMRSFARFIPRLLIVGGIIGLICSFIISYDKVQLLKNPSFSPNCDLNPIISCGSVMSSKQGEAFGFPNPWIGLVSFGILITVGMALLALNNKEPARLFRRWFWLGLQAGTIFGVLFVHWLFFQTVYRIHALCPYCMVVWVVTITTFWYTLLYNIETGVIRLPAKLQTAGGFARKHHLDILIFWLLVIFVLIMNHFWYYFGKQLGF